MQVPFGEWLPDLPDHLNKGATTRATINFEKPVKASETGKDLQKIILLSFLSSKNVLKL